MKPAWQTFWAAIGLCLLVCPLWAEDAASLVTQGDAAYAKREDIPEAKIAMVTFERAAVMGSTHAYEGYWKAARSAWWLGENTQDRSEQLGYFQRAMNLAQKGIDLRPDGVEAHFWLGAAAGCYGKAKGVLKSLSLVKPIRREMNEVIRLDDHYLSGAAYRILGVVDYKVPPLMGGNKARAKQLLDKTLSMSSNDPFIFYDLVDFYKVTGDLNKSKAALEALRTLQAPPDFVPEQKMLLSKAEKIVNGVVH